VTRRLRLGRYAGHGPASSKMAQLGFTLKTFEMEV
jgi:hypothetical protein